MNEEKTEEKKEVKETQEKELEEILNFDKPDFVFSPKGRHEWRQRGYYLVCVSCEIQHAIWIGPDKIMVGEDKEGKPLLKTREELKMK